VQKGSESSYPPNVLATTFSLILIVRPTFSLMENGPDLVAIGLLFISTIRLRVKPGIKSSTTTLSTIVAKERNYKLLS
jgi:hypothetical protein